MEKATTLERILTWARDFRAGELTVDDIQDRFAVLDLSEDHLAPPLRKRLVEAQRELDSIRFGVCESGQSAEIGRIFLELERVAADNGPAGSNRKLNRD